MGRRGGQIKECLTVFMAVFSSLAGIYGLYDAYTKNQVSVIVMMSALLTLYYWMCFYPINNKT